MITTLQTILLTILITVWLVFSLVFLITAIQSFFNDRTHEKREAEKEKREIEYHDARMKEFEK